MTADETGVDETGVDETVVDETVDELGIKRPYSEGLGFESQLNLVL